MKSKYQKPTSNVIECFFERVIATSSDAEGTINPMPWGDNKKEGINSEDWSDSNDNFDWE